MSKYKKRHTYLYLHKIHRVNVQSIYFLLNNENKINHLGTYIKFLMIERIGTSIYFLMQCVYLKQ